MSTLAALKPKVVSAPEPWRAPSATRRIVVVEDDPDTRMVYEAILGHEGYEVLSVGTGPNGVAAALQILPDLVITDLRLPDFSGTVVAESLDEIAETRSIPRIALSGELHRYDRDTLDRLFDRVLAKPVPRTDLLEAVRALLL